MTEQFIGENLNLILWAGLGIITGLIAYLSDPEKSRSSGLATILSGVVGAFLGGFAGNWIFTEGLSGFDPASLGLALGGGLILGALYRMIFRDRGHIRTRSTRLQ